MCFAFRSERHLVVRGQRARVGDVRGADQAAVPVVELDGQHVFERRSGESALGERPATQHEQPAAALGDEVGHQRELRAGEEVGFDVGHDQRVISEQLIAARRETGGERRRAAGARLYEKRVDAVGVLSFSGHRVDLEAGIDRPRARHEAVLEARRPFDREHAALAPGRIDEHRSSVVFDDRLRRVAGDVRRVHSWIHGIGRDGEHLVDRRSVGHGHEPPRLHHLAVRHDADGKRRPSEARADRGDMKIDLRLIEARIPGDEAHDLAIARAVGRADADGVHRRPR